VGHRHKVNTCKGKYQELYMFVTVTHVHTHGRGIFILNARVFLRE